VKINGNDQKLALVIKAFNETIVPELNSSSAQATAGIIAATLEDLLKRETVSAEMLRQCLDEGERAEKTMRNQGPFNNLRQRTRP